ncbi:putative RING finger and SPRY domain-containing protein 1 [Apostichopus japonicus]|uniref:Putative RING finger and SPRY domain-containing protein 1 n=1 Tax=Stichopus japonicus TaxID=307972 RepID=A0A2G8K3Q0_STIJA|nr:putative RING finger and SPRY domain-containing protein 1 [Apostichopus japonicus]
MGNSCFGKRRRTDHAYGPQVPQNVNSRGEEAQLWSPVPRLYPDRPHNGIVMLRGSHMFTCDMNYIWNMDVESLVLLTLKEIRRLVDNNQEPPLSIIRLNEIGESESGWVQVVQAMISTIPMDDPLGPAVIALLLDECPLPTVETVEKLYDILKPSAELAQEALHLPAKHRNFTCILGCVAGILAGLKSVELLKDSVLEYLLTLLDPKFAQEVVLFALVALEKFAQTGENKATIRKSGIQEKLMELEKYQDSSLTKFREVGFCAQWCLDNTLPIDGRTLTFEGLSMEKCNVILNDHDVSEYLKISADGLEARSDALSFESVRSTFCVDEGTWYYEVLVLTDGVMQIGWATKQSKFLNHEGVGIGDDEYSFSYDGCRQLYWYNAKSRPHDHPQWKPGDIIGFLIDLEKKQMVFSRNGISFPPVNDVFQSVCSGFFAAASFMSFQQCRFNFGMTPFKFPPKVPFKKFNDYAFLPPEKKIILPRFQKMKLLSSMSISESSCSICCDMDANAKLVPCNHGGLCMDCAVQVEQCPLCRVKISKRIQLSPADPGLYQDEIG